MVMVKRVLVSDATSYKAVVICSFIKQYYPDIFIVSCDHRPLSSWFHTKHSDVHVIIQNDIQKQDAYIAELASLIHTYHIEVFIPVNSNEMNVLLQHRESLGACLDYWGSYDAFQTLNDKSRLQDLCESLQIRVPQRFSTMASIRYPVVIKPAVSSSAKNVHYCYNQTQLTQIVQHFDQWIVQSYVQGIGVGYSVFARNGNILTGAGHKRLAEYPISGGSSMYREAYVDDQMLAIATQLIEEMCWSGFAMFEFKLTDEGDIVLIEVNPRIWGSINQGLVNGTNYFADLLGDVEMRASEPKMTFLSPFVYLSLIQYLLSGNPRPVKNFVKNVSSNTSDINIFTDTLGWMGSLVRLL